jgi:hypothetical protein
LSDFISEERNNGRCRVEEEHKRKREREEWSGVAGIVEQRERGTYSGVYLLATQCKHQN